MTHDKSHAAAERLAEAVEDAMQMEYKRGKLSPVGWKDGGLMPVYRAMLAYFDATDKRKKETKR